MCGISGIVGREASASGLDKMISIMSHRGPDDTGSFVKDNVCLGHNRLSIIDLSALGHQPMFDNSGRYCIIFNGEIYNYIELKNEIKHLYNFKSKSDTEVILALYILYGNDFLKKLNGMFALVIYDNVENKILAARDHIGIKPFFYSLKNNTLYFASEIKALLAAGIGALPNNKVIYNYLAKGYLDYSSETFFNNILSLPPGNYMEFSNGTLDIKPYWEIKKTIAASAGGVKKSYDDYLEELNSLLYNSVLMQLRSDVPLGIHLSGGLDSSLLLGYLDKIIGNSTIKAFTGIFGDSRYDEQIFAESIVKNLKIDHHLALCPVNRFWELVDKVLYYQDQPFGGLSTMLHYSIDEEVRKNDVIVAVEGQGGDELFGGYNYYFYDYLAELEKAGDNSLNNFINDYSSFHDMLPENIKSAYSRQRESKSILYQDGTDFLKPDCINDDFVKHNIHEHIFENGVEDSFTHSRFLDTRYKKIPRVLRFNDIQAMANSVELRVPILDYRIVEFAFSLPPSAFYSGGKSKSLLRDLCIKYDIIPSHLAKAPKRSVVNPQREWFKNELSAEVISRLENSVLYDLGYLKKQRVTEELNEYMNSDKPANSNYIWQWLNLDMWFRNFII